MVARKTTKRKTTTRKKAPTTNGKKKVLPKRITTNQATVTTNEVDRFELVFNHVLARTGFLKDYLHAERDIDRECGYINTNEITTTLLKYFYDREPIATRVVKIYPEECWKSNPRVFETEDTDQITAFEQAWDDLALSLTGESKFRKKEGSPIWEYLKRADILSGIGFFGVIFLGLDDGEKELSLEAKPREGQKLLFMRAFDQSSVEISNYESDPSNPRFGLPNEYSIDFSTPNETRDGIGISNQTKKIHWTRVIHLADNLGSNEVFGVPRMRPVFNRLWDLRKLYGGSAEMFWKGAFPGLSFETHPALGANVSMDVDSLKENVEDYYEGLKRYILSKGMSTKSLAPQVADPTNHIDRQIDAICIQGGYPKRIFMGSERGELASSQDKVSWNERLMNRQNTYITPRVVVPLVDRLIFLGVLPEPEEYHVQWPDLEAISDMEKAEIAAKKTESLVKYVAGNAEPVVAPLDYLIRFLNIPQEEAVAVLEAAEERMEEEIEKAVMEGREIMEEEEVPEEEEMEEEDKEVLV